MQNPGKEANRKHLVQNGSENRNSQRALSKDKEGQNLLEFLTIWNDIKSQ